MKGAKNLCYITEKELDWSLLNKTNITEPNEKSISNYRFKTVFSYLYMTKSGKGVYPEEYVLLQNFIKYLRSQCIQNNKFDIA